MAENQDGAQAPLNEFVREVARGLVSQRDGVGLQKYQDFIATHMGQRFKDSLKEGMSCFGLGLSGEAGEVSEIIKKVFYHDHPLTDELKAKILRELGDQLWYNFAIAYLLGFTAADVVNANVIKLAVRYPNGFTEADSIARRDPK